MDLLKALESADQIEFMGERHIVVRFDPCVDEDIKPYITVLKKYSDTLWCEWDIDFSDLITDPRLKVFRAVQSYFTSGEPDADQNPSNP